ncbi:hypothetical protein ACFQHW_08815 [Lapidilactobacillus achengensis]|uniref:Uncharacterized protein n=1 Tax=Lapidilactobacillus achengensis TaxID=2486000 RepID=A0ABW1URQ1_9LACO|nr:hypothetical protein [Lapidilactobacillus achengensis]
MDEQWLQQTLADLSQQLPQYQDRALLAVTQTYVADLAQRLVNGQGELDGRIWNHEQW